MTILTSRCPHCQSMNRIPSERVNDAPKCGKCQSDVLDGKPIEGTNDNFNALLNSDVPVVVDFWAPWCGPCQSFAPAFAAVAEQEEGRARFVKIDTEAQQALAAQYRIRSIPTLMVFKNGERVDVLNGALPQNAFSDWLSQHLS
ncbi:MULTISPECIES: thioredoxin TrxC [Salinivibrio]|uniref:Thioredoxin n=1 Tax=Salinivibrio kushneri TaxID=1908198 RepID=A0AB36K1J6_9GAMM|nr:MULTISPECIES: thioredoxin TrxC [Salinivibrio]ODP96697.1 thioredoxin TrxC [Salinivibrio sp. BNH]OOE35498.1 thioredoxin TrxC [Salinivibrio kushneri]OOE41703.1 thioredoxin TrxC [Salinivibrio kushneri]OOE48643.1 thioredoxin TrxC [Salinivibrio kushneri]OOE49895.1 thioredoxin TrxC [Salinivibrio kushneri]